MLRITLLLAVCACGATSPASDEPPDPTTAQARCLPVVGHCGCSYACGRSEGSAQNGNLRVRTTADDELVEARVESWCQPEGECRDAYVRPLPCGGECIPTRLFDGCHFEGLNCVQPAIDIFRAEAEDWLKEIVMRQGMFRAEFGQYGPLSIEPLGWTPEQLPSEPTPWQGVGEWRELGVREGEPTSLQFRMWVGRPGTDPPVSAPPTANQDFWYVAWARGRVDGELVTLQRVSWNTETTVVDARE